MWIRCRIAYGAVVALALTSRVAAFGLPEPILEPYSYQQNFETGELSAWASYPSWQDTAYDPNIRVNAIVPGEPNLSLVQKVTPYTHVDAYAGAVKELDAYFTPDSTIAFRYYLKTHLPVEYLIVRLAAGPVGKIDYAIKNPETNRWTNVTLRFADFARANPVLEVNGQCKMNGLAVLVKVSTADPDMPIYLGLDDVVIAAAQEAAFQFVEPAVDKLDEWKPFIARTHYMRGDVLSLSGAWPFEAEDVRLKLMRWPDGSEPVYTGDLEKNEHGAWSCAVPLDFPEGLYLATLHAEQGTGVAETPIAFYIAPQGLGGKHPRLWFDDKGRQRVIERLATERFGGVAESMRTEAKTAREQLPLDGVVFDIDQFPDEEWIDTLTAWFSRITSWGQAVSANALAYSLFADEEAGTYAKDLMVKVSGFPYWLHPWMAKRGRHSYYPVGELGMDWALGYDLLYGLMSEPERAVVRAAMMNSVVLGCHKGYVEDDLVTSNTSNWVAHITGGSLMCQAAMYGDGDDVKHSEPYLTGALFKNHALVQSALGRDGSYGEGYGYYNFSMKSWARSLPAVENVFHVDLSEKINGSYQELVWAGLIKEKKFFYFGDSGGNLGPLTNWAWLLPKYQDPLLGWLYKFLKSGETFMDVIYDTANVPQQTPFDESPVRLFRDVGTTVFKSGWESKDFVFVMRAGPFINHQHLDQGSFWLAYRGATFIEERHGSTYYKDVLYQPWYTQPVAHSTILIDGNHQSQRVGDLLGNLDGFEDYAFTTHFLDTDQAAFASGNIGRLYWGKVDGLVRNVLYIKPNAILMADVAIPAGEDVDVTLLYQTLRLADIAPNAKRSTIEKDGQTLTIDHLSPGSVDVTAVETPHYLATLLNDNPLVNEGMLTVTARTSGEPLVMANLLTTADAALIERETRDGYVAGRVNGVPFYVNTSPGERYVAAAGWSTDALMAARTKAGLFLAMVSHYKAGPNLAVDVAAPIACLVSDNTLRYSHDRDARLNLILPSRPAAVTLNGEPAPFTFDDSTGSVSLVLPAGTGVLAWE